MDCPIVSTRNGKVKGSVSQLECKDAKPVYTYRNIPFGKPPTGKQRFMPPKAANSWEGVRDGTVVGVIPVQSTLHDEVMSRYFPIQLPCERDQVKVGEDCLHLTVYTPNTSGGKKLPVMVWLYGGGFAIGSEVNYDGRPVAGMNDVVVVVPNYRVNIFGFLSLGKDSICPGNVALMDQKLALEWVRDNIEAFGGDKDNVTLYGESAGAISVNHHIISPSSRGLFHKAISHSGQSNMPGMVLSEEKMKNNLAAFLKHLKINETEKPKILEALQQVPPDDLVKAQNELAMQRVQFLPVLDGVFLTKSPEQCLKEKDFAKVPYIIGCNNSEGDGILSLAVAMDFEKGLTEEQARTNLYVPKNKEIFDEWKKFYIKDENDERKFSKLFGQLIADALIVYPAVCTADCYSGKASTFVYQGAFQLRMHHDNAYGKEMAKKVDWCECDHSDEIAMTWGMPFLPGEMPHGAKFSDEEKELSRKVMTYITNFAKTGNTNKGAKVDVDWPKYSKGGKYIVLNHKISVKKNLFGEKKDFWQNKMPELKKKFPIEE